MKLRYLYRAFKARYRDERAELLTALLAIRPGDTVADIGANKGAYLYWLQKAVGETGKVFAYEPQPALAGYLQSVCELMRWKNVLVRDCALSDSPGVGMLNVPGAADSPGASLEGAITERTDCRQFECPVDTLDNQLRDAARVALLKIDVEGHELRVFQGAKEVLRHHRPLIICECEARHLSQHTMQDVFNHLQACGYEGSFFSPRGVRPLSEFDPRHHQKQAGERFWDAPDYCNNFLFRAQKRPA